MGEKMELYLCRCCRGIEDQELWIRFPSKPENEFGLGRSQENHVRLLSAHVSRSHASITKMTDEKFAIKDKGSLYGIHVNDSRIEAGVWRFLKVDDRVEIGRPVDDELSKGVDEGDRFLYSVKAASSVELDAKKPGPKSHIGQSFAQFVKIKPKKNSFPEVPNSKLLPQKRSYDEENHKNIETVVKDGDKLVVAENSCVEKAPKVEKEMEQENKRLKLELEQKVVALKDEIEARNEKLKEEQKRIAAELEENFKSKLVEKEVELEMRLQLEKDIALEQCKASIVKQEKPSSSMSLSTVVDAMDNELQCSICSELFIVSMTLGCAHTFCSHCITQWRKVKNICPVCRNSISSTTRSLVLDNYIDKVMESLSDERKENRRKIIEERKKEEQRCQDAMASMMRGRSRLRGGRTRGRGSNTSTSTRDGNMGVRGRGHVRGNGSPATRTRSAVVVISDDESSEGLDLSSDGSFMSEDNDGSVGYWEILEWR